MQCPCCRQKFLVNNFLTGNQPLAMPRNVAKKYDKKPATQPEPVPVSGPTQTISKPKTGGQNARKALRQKIKEKAHKESRVSKIDPLEMLE